MATRRGLEPLTSAVTGRHSNQLNYRAVKGKYLWWAMTGSNCRHLACKASALPAELIAHNGDPPRNRTVNLLIKSQLLCQLS